MQAQGGKMADWAILATFLELFGPWFPFLENEDNSKGSMGGLNDVRHVMTLGISKSNDD